MRTGFVKVVRAAAHFEVGSVSGLGVDTVVGIGVGPDFGEVKGFALGNKTAAEVDLGAAVERMVMVAGYETLLRVQTE